MPLLTYFTPLFLLTGALLATLMTPTLGAAILLFSAWVYLIPPLLCRIVTGLFGKPDGDFSQDASEFKHWWFLTQLQILFNRLSVLEEILRLLPGVYGLWLRLWGAQVSLFAYWSPAVIVADRYHLHIGAGAILGGGCRIGGHVLQRLQDGNMRLLVGPVHIHKGAMIGLHAAIGPHSVVTENQTLPAARLLKPGYHWTQGKAVHPHAAGQGGDKKT